MKSYIRLGVIFLLIIQVLCGCNKRDLIQDQEDMQEDVAVAVQHKISKTPYTGYFQKEIDLALYEPSQGAYLGAYVLGNPEIEFDMTKFEQAVDKQIAIGLRHYQMGDPFPARWLLECLAKKKAPHVVIAPSPMGSPYDKEALEETAKKFKHTYGVPVFVEFYPNPKTFRDPMKYIAYFQLAKEIFAQHAPNVAFVWSVDIEDVYDAMVYYPGDEYVDWVGLSMYFPIYKNGQRYQLDLEQKLSYFYNMYKDSKPIMISKLAISHYSKQDHVFYIEEAKDMMNQIYKEVPLRYPRIKAINYVDIDNIKVAPGSMGTDNFRVSTEPKITSVYRQAISSPYYLGTVEEAEQERGTQWSKMQTAIYEQDHTLYVLEDTIIYDWKIPLTDKMRACRVMFSGSPYYPIEQVVKAMGYKQSFKEDTLRIYP